MDVSPLRFHIPQLKTGAVVVPQQCPSIHSRPPPWSDIGVARLTLAPYRDPSSNIAWYTSTIGSWSHFSMALCICSSSAKRFLPRDVVDDT